MRSHEVDHIVWTHCDPCDVTFDPMEQDIPWLKLFPSYEVSHAPLIRALVRTSEAVGGMAVAPVTAVA